MATAAAAASNPGDDVVHKLCGPLTEQQRSVVLAPLDKPLLVPACPGSGKTRTLITKAAYLLATEQVEPRQLLMVTFSRASTGETRDRLRSLFLELASGLRAERVSVLTLHGYAYTVLFGSSPDDFARICRRRKGARKLEESERSALVKEAVTQCNMRDEARQRRAGSGGSPTKQQQQQQRAAGQSERVSMENYLAAYGTAAEHEGLTFEQLSKSDKKRHGEVRKYISKRKMEMEDAPDLERLGPSDIDQLSDNEFCYGFYELHMRRLNCIDFDDMICMAVKLMEHSPHTQRQQRGRYKVVCVDEFQDSKLHDAAATPCTTPRSETRVRGRVCVCNGGRTSGSQRLTHGGRMRTRCLSLPVSLSFALLSFRWSVQPTPRNCACSRRSWAGGRPLWRWATTTSAFTSGATRDRNACSSLRSTLAARRAPSRSPRTSAVPGRLSRRRMRSSSTIGSAS